MRRYLLVVLLLFGTAGSGHAHGLLIPADKTLPPLAMLNHLVTISLQDQVAVTHLEQTFRNHTDRPLEATYVFPVPKGASVQKFTMLVDGKEVAGELVEAAKARDLYTSIVRRTLDPGLLEYLGRDLFQVKVFPVPAKGDLKLTLNYTSLCPRDHDLVEFVYPLKTDGQAARTLEKFSLRATLKSQHPLQNVYSPSHAIAVTRPNDHEAVVTFEHDQALLDKDFQLFYAVGDQDVGLTALTQRPLSSDPGFFLLLISPRVELSQQQQVPRDLVLVLDTSGSMRGAKLDQAKKALKYCLDHLGTQDRFALLNFATTVNRYHDGLLPAAKEQLEQADKWVDQLEATGGTAIQDALHAALDLRTSDTGRTFTVVFFTDGQPTIGETDPEKILKSVVARNTSNTRLFTFGVGDDVNATLLDQLADQARAVSTYVRPAEDIEAKVSSLFDKMSHPVLADLKVTVTGEVKLQEVYPPQLPDLFQGGQVVVLGRYTGQGPSAVKLTGSVGSEKREFVYEWTFPGKTTEERSFVEQLWARRKVGYLLDQIRANGEKKELVDEVVTLAKKYGIATPYTSYLIVPDAPAPVVNAPTGRPNVSFGPGYGIQGGGFGGRAGGMPLPPPALAPAAGASATQSVTTFARQAGQKPGELGANRGKLTEEQLRRAADDKGRNEGEKRSLQMALDQKAAYDFAAKALQDKDLNGVQAGRFGVDLSISSNNLKSQSQLTPAALRNVYGRNCLEIGGVWIDDQFDAHMPTLTVKAMSDAYFRLLERHPQLKEVFQLGNYLVWVTPNGTALVIDTKEGKEKLSDAEIDRLFVAKK